MQGSNRCCCGGIDGVGLALPSAREFAHSLRGCSWHIVHDLAFADQPLREMSPETPSVFDCPPAIFELSCPSQRLAIASNTCIDAQRRNQSVRQRINSTCCASMLMLVSGTLSLVIAVVSVPV